MSWRWLAGLFLVSLAADASADDWGAIEVRRAYHARVPPIIERITRLRLIAVDVEVEARVSGMFDPAQLAIADADRGEPVRVPSLMLRLTGDGAPADARDPDFAGEPDRFRLRLVGALPRATSRIALRYRGTAVGSPAAIAPAGPAITAPSQRVVAHAAAGPAPLEGYWRHRVLIEARDWSRVAEPRAFAIVYRLTGAERRADTDRWIEVDEANHPVDQAIDRRPHVVPIRRFVLELWLVAGGTPIALDHLGRRMDLPAARLVLPAAADKALAGAQPDLDASHYRPAD